jgi:hypothetical protein
VCRSASGHERPRPCEDAAVVSVSLSVARIRRRRGWIKIDRRMPGIENEGIAAILNRRGGQI